MNGLELIIFIIIVLFGSNAVQQDLDEKMKREEQDIILIECSNELCTELDKDFKPTEEKVEWI